MAGFLEEASAFIFGTQAEWSLVRIDPPEEQPLTGQFHPEQLTEDTSTQFAISTVPMSTVPYVQWTGANIRRLTFSARMWNQRTPGGALDSLGVKLPENPIIKGYYDVSKEIKRLRNAMKPDPGLNRPARFRFVYGDISMDVFIASLGGIRYTEVWPDGRVKGVTFELELIEAPNPASPKVTDPSILPHDSRHKPVVLGDTYESLAKRQYSNPLIGVLLRQRNKKAFVTSGDIVRLPDKERFRNAELEPQSYALSDSEAAVRARAQLLEDRGGTKQMPFVLQ